MQCRRCGHDNESGANFCSSCGATLGDADETTVSLGLLEDRQELEAELGALLINEIITHKGVEVAGQLPPELQSYTAFHSGVSTASKDPAAAKALAEFLTTPAAAAVFKAKGQEPG